MADVTLAASHEVPLSANELFDLFGATADSSWLFDAVCDSVRPGAPVSLTVPMGYAAPQPVQLLGRIGRCVTGKLIEIVHDQPWQGTIRLRLTATSARSTRVTVTADLDERGLSWIMDQRGWPSSTPVDESLHRVGLLTSKTGSGAVYTVACEYLAQMAVEDINAEGGLRGQLVDLVVADDATDPRRAAAETQRLIDLGCQSIVASVTSVSFDAAARVAGPTGVPIIHPHVNEGGGTKHVVRWGERPIDQVRAVASSAMKSADGKRWYLVGNNYSFAHGAHSAGAQAIAEAGGQVLGRQLVPLGTTYFADVLEDMERSGADCVLSCLVGADEVAFERQVWEAGLRSRWETLSLAMEESTRERIGNEAANGIWAAMGYFQSLDTPENTALLHRYRERFGAWAPPVSSFSESMYGALLLYASAVRSSPANDRAAVVAQLYSARGRMPRGMVTSEGPDALHQSLYVARAVNDGFRVVTG